MEDIKYKDFFTLNESPDTIEMDGKVLTFLAEDAVPFFYVPRIKIGIVGSEGSTHESTKQHVFDIWDDKGIFRTSDYFFVNGVYIGIYNKNLTGEELKEYFMDHIFKFSDPSILSGRMWKKDKVISFWDTKEKVNPHIEEIKGIIEFYTLKDSDGWKYEFIKDFGGPKPLDANRDDEISDEEYKKLLAIQHIDPNAKQQLKNKGLLKASPVKEPEWKKEFQENIDPEELKMGEKEEMEHTDDPKIAKKIATDHLKEDPKYYTKLKKCMGEIFGDINEETIYHGTIIDNIPEIKKYGLLPNRGEFVKTFYDDYNEEDLPELVFGADKKTIRKALNAIMFQVGNKLNKWHSSVSLNDIRNHGALVIVKDSSQFKNRRDRDEDEYTEHPITVEPGDYYSEDSVGINIILTGSKLVDFLKKLINKSTDKRLYNDIFKENREIRSIKLTKILNDIISEGKEKSNYELTNVYLNGKRINGITQAYSESQALFNLIWRNLPENNRKTMAPIKVSEAKKLGGFKIKKIEKSQLQSPNIRLPYRDD